MYNEILLSYLKKKLSLAIYSQWMVLEDVMLNELTLTQTI